MKRRSKVSHAAAKTKAPLGAAALHLGETRGLVAPVPNKTTTVTLRLSGPWYILWERLRKAVPGVSDAELLRQGVALRMAIAARDAKGAKPRAYIEFHDEKGRKITADLEEYVGFGN